ncbi:MAG: hypothetical protein ACLP9S_04765 [Syntrophales bacterium]
MREVQFTKLLTVVLSKDTFLKIKTITDQEKISMSEWVRKAIDQLMGKEERLKERRTKNETGS